jgi:hypothetical protein
MKLDVRIRSIMRILTGMMSSHVWLRVRNDSDTLASSYVGHVVALARFAGM